jgi:predicted protein tyrosine phosphatase
MSDYFVLKRADPPKKWQVRVPTASGRGRTVKFGEAGASDFTKHKDTARRQRYRDRHRRDNIRDPYSPGFWSWYALWGESSNLDTAFKDAVRRAKKLLPSGVRENPMNEEPCIHVFSRLDLETHLHADGFDEMGGLISIGDPDGSEPWFVEEAAANGVEVLRLEFRDVEDPKLSLPPDEAAVGHLLAYLMDVLPDLDGCLVVHCEWGVSRSTAAALTAFSMAFGPGREPEAAAHLVEIAPQAEPNLLMITYADHMMHRDGRLLDVAELINEDSP